MGTGERRIGNPMEFREDMYSLLFISMVKPVYKKFCEEHQEQDFGERLVNAVNALEEEKENEEDSGEGEQEPVSTINDPVETLATEAEDE